MVKPKNKIIINTGAKTHLNFQDFLKKLNKNFLNLNNFIKHYFLAKFS